MLQELNGTSIKYLTKVTGRCICMDKKYIVVYQHTTTLVFGLTMFAVDFDKAQDIWDNFKSSPEYKPVRILKVD